mmetsp:Transcript_31332/g.82113  ORF Transcript_31332/g.82113 Transcript_31332/m.82113 type:complete len:203 (-) Transcript_31332:66-674(-)
MDRSESVRKAQSRSRIRPARSNGDGGTTGVCQIALLGLLGLLGLSIFGSFTYLFWAGSRPPVDQLLTADLTRVELMARVETLTQELEALDRELAGRRAKWDQYHRERAAAFEVLLPRNVSQRIRPDFRCGPDFLAPDGTAYAECDPSKDSDPGGPCCRPDSGWCGNVRRKKWGHCDCTDCVDFSQVHELRQSIATKLSSPNV